MTHSFSDLVSLVKKLRAPDGCPWDREQTFKTMIPFILEESQEVIHAIKAEDFENLKEELGDVLLHIVMMSNMAEEKGLFSISDVINGISEKMIRRHPHVFGDTKAESVDDVLHNWEKIKENEKKSK